MTSPVVANRIIITCTHSGFLQSISSRPLLLKSMFESREKTTVSAAIFCPVISICDVINKAGMCVVNLSNKSQADLCFVVVVVVVVVVVLGGVVFLVFALHW